MQYKFSYEEKINFYQEALNGFRRLDAGPWICNVLAYLARQRGIYTADPTEFCKESFPEFWEEVLKYQKRYSILAQFPLIKDGDLLREQALIKAINKCKIYLDSIPSTAAYGSMPYRSYSFIEEMNKYRWQEISLNTSKIQKMKEENLIKGNQLSDEIRSTQRHIDIWNEATKFYIDCYTPVCIDGSSTARSGKLPADAFDVIKKISLAYLRNELLDLEKQFAAL